MYTLIYTDDSPISPPDTIMHSISEEDAANLLRNSLPVTRIKEFEIGTIVVWYASILVGARIIIIKEN